MIVVIALCVSALRAASPSETAVSNIFRKADARLAHFVELQRTGVGRGIDLVIAIGSRDILSVGNATFWSEDRKVGLFLQEKNQPDRVHVLDTKAGLPDCYARIERVTATDTVISCRGEKSTTYPNQKWVYDVGTRKLIRQFSYQPFAMKRIDSRGAGAVFVGTDGERGIAVKYGPNREPAFQVLRDAPPRSQMEAVKTPAQAGVTSFSRTTYDQFAAARPQRVKDGYRREGTQILESAGPWQREGERIWFGKTFYDGEGETGVGGFGYFDQAAKKLRLFAPPEIVNWSVSALDGTPDAVWLALVNNGEWGGQAADCFGTIARVAPYVGFLCRISRTAWTKLAGEFWPQRNSDSRWWRKIRSRASSWIRPWMVDGEWFQPASNGITKKAPVLPEPSRLV